MERRLTAVLVADMAAYSRLMELDEDGVIARQKEYRREVIDPTIAIRNGRIVKTTGDGMLAEFQSAQDAVQAAVDIQETMSRREAESIPDKRITYRVGINLGDVVHDEDDIFGDGVNVAARLQTIAEPGGICVSDLVHQTVNERIGAPFRDMGRQRVKNISRPIRVWQWTPKAKSEMIEPVEEALQQRVHYTTSEDGTHIAWAGVGQGLPVLKAPNWLNHLEYEWKSPCWAPMLAECARRFQLVRFDQRGNGLSDWDPDIISADAMQQDMNAVADAAGLGRFALLGISQGGAFSIRYAVENPERVKCLIILGGYVRGRLRRPDPEQKKLFDMLTNTITQGWGSPNPVFRHFFTSSFIPDASSGIADSFDELQRIATNPDAALRLWRMNAEIDVSDLATKVQVPTLVLHCAGERVAPIEEGRLIARLIPNATFVELPGNNHVLLENSPAFALFFEEVSDFLKKHAD